MSAANRPAGLDAVPAEVTDAVLAAVDRDRVVELTAELVRLPTVTGQESAGQHRMAALLAGSGMDVEVVTTDIADLVDDPFYSAEVARDEVVGVVGRAGSHGPGAGRQLLIDGHLDVVPPGDTAGWSTPPFEPQVRGGRLYGRGSCDMKGGLAAAVHAVEAVLASGVELAGGVALASVAGEEDGGCGTLALLRHGVHADACVIAEPTGLAVVPAVAGALSWRITVPGRTAHGCLREEGVSAIEAFWPVHRAVLALEQRRNARVDDPLFAWLERPFAICGGRIVGGDWPSNEAAELVWEGRYGVAPGEDLDAARAELEQAVAQASAEDPWLAGSPATVTWWGGRFVPGATPLDDPVVTDAVAAVTAATGAVPELKAMPYGCDLGLTRTLAGIPTVVLGPGDIRAAHRPDESVPVAELEAAARTFACLILATCGVR